MPFQDLLVPEGLLIPASCPLLLAPVSGTCRHLEVRPWLVFRAEVCWATGEVGRFVVPGVGSPVIALNGSHPVVTIEAL